VTSAAEWGLVRLSPAHPSWHVQLPGADRTACGREPGPSAVRADPGSGLPSGPVCTACRPHLDDGGQR
jgi:hypothetical protein